jgi:hypothetical protein
LIERVTKDLDLVALVAGDKLIKPVPLPAALDEAANDVAKLMKLSRGWLNAGPASLLDLGLPAGFLERTVRQDYDGLVVHLASRYDQVCFKRLVPAPEELRRAAAWAMTHDDSEGFRQILAQVLAALGVEPGDA